MDVNSLKNVVVQQLMFEVVKNSTNNSSAFGILLEGLSKVFDEYNLPIKTDGESIVFQNDINTKNSNDKNVDKNELMNNIKRAVKNASKKYGVDENLIMSVIKNESNFDPYAKSSAGAQGLMQLMPSTAQALGVSNPFDITQNVNAGTEYLRNLLDMYGNCKQIALAAYNAGCGTVSKRGVKNIQDISKMPKETVNYVNKVMRSYDKNL